MWSLSLGVWVSKPEAVDLEADQVRVCGFGGLRFGV